MSQKATKYLKKVYINRKNKNSAYSIRAFARDCNLPGGRVSEYFSGKRQLTFSAASTINEKSNLSPTEKDHLMLYFQNEKAFKTIDGSYYQKISHPIFYAILSVLEADDFKPDIEWISERLGEPKKTIKENLLLLEKYELIGQNSKGYFLKQVSVKTSDEIPSQAIRDSHKIRLKKIIDNIDKVKVSDRHVSSITMCISKKKIALAKNKIELFLDEMSDLLESSDQKEIYELNIQLFPWKTNS